MVLHRYIEQVLLKILFDTKDTYTHFERESFYLKINKRTVGSQYEEMAADFLKEQGLYIKERNFRCKSGEVDLIALDGEYLVFVEVKYRKTHNSGWAAAAVNKRKQQIISRVAQFYLIRYGYAEVPCRFDVVGIDGEQIQWIKNAFDYCG